jgi:LSD1 subclass zinc finger protein
MSSFSEETKAINLELACSGCGATLTFKPGTRHLSCEYCGASNEIAQPEDRGKIRETRLDEYLVNHFDQEEQMEITTVKCDGCHALVSLDHKTTSDRCPFCTSPLIIKDGSIARTHKPQYVLPFGMDEKKAREGFRRWLKSLWFAPRDLKHYADHAGRLSGMYLPFWTFDCDTKTSYTGQRGDFYTTTENYQAVENGNSVTKTRQVQRTRWTPASGNVSQVFDDILIEGTTSLPQKLLRALQPWDLKNLVSYNDKYLSGFRTESYQVDISHAYQQAKKVMEMLIEQSIRADIGGNEQRIHYTNTTYSNPSFKHVLLPVWISAYRYNNKLYQFVINARTGEVQGERPYSKIKIALLVIFGVVALIALYYALQ